MKKTETACFVVGICSNDNRFEGRSSGKLNDVLDRIGEKMEAQLKPKDWETHKSPPHQIRWRNTAEWARNHMVNKTSLIKKGSKRGIWEISTKGRKWLEEQN